MTRSDLAIVRESLRASRTELTELIDQDIHVPAGPLLEQLAESEQIIEVYLATIQK